MPWASSSWRPRIDGAHVFSTPCSVTSCWELKISHDGFVHHRSVNAMNQSVIKYLSIPNWMQIPRERVFLAEGTFSMKALGGKNALLVEKYQKDQCVWNRGPHPLWHLHVFRLPNFGAPPQTYRVRNSGAQKSVFKTLQVTLLQGKIRRPPV